MIDNQNEAPRLPRLPWIVSEYLHAKDKLGILSQDNEIIIGCGHKLPNYILQAICDRVNRYDALEASHARLVKALEGIATYASAKSQLSYEGWLSGVEDIAEQALAEAKTLTS